IHYGVLQTIVFVLIVWVSLGDLVTGRVAVSELSGVIGVVDVVSEAGTQYQNETKSVLAGIFGVLSMMALIAVNLAVMNMLPIPALDGGRIFFVLLNGILFAVAKRRIPERYEGYVHAGAFVVLLALMAVVALHDVWNIFV
ncbi:MAG: site-2 protease family protein, partial [Oscillospiraceae bacterium]